MQMDSSRSTARVGACEKCCFTSSTISLTVINIVDFLLACFILSFALYLWSKLGDTWSSPETSWLLWSAAVVSVLLFLISCSSFIAMTSPACRCMASVTDILAIVIALLDLAIGIACFKLRPLILGFLSDHQDETGLTDKDLHRVKNWYTVIAGTFFLSLFLEAIRVWMNRGYSDAARRIDREYSALLAEEDRDWEQRHEDKAQLTSEKYKALRAYYRQKYNMNDRPGEQAGDANI